ncbi:MAG: serine/threonine protein kinase [Planctomycetaceae bacterium]|nr:serine/threonine protein kinase [Planctomycetaceae bacterium]
METRRMGPFLLDEQIGAGGMGVVYRATYIKTGQQVAVKFVPVELAENERITARFERELNILRKLRHPHIVHCYGGGLEGSRLYYAMELVPGGTVAQLLRERGKLSWETTIQYGLQIASALHHAHQAGIIHRDLKPANLLIAKEGKIKLSDFGLARDITATGLTAAGRALGTFAYMSPEMIRGTPPVSHKSDLYSLGCVLYEFLAGRPPFKGDSPAEMIYQHMEQDPPRVSTVALDCPLWLEALITQLLEKDPAKRPRDAAAVETALHEVQSKVATQASFAGHSLSGGPTSLSVERDLSEVRKLVQKKKPKPKEQAPFFQQAWFLAACLLAILGVVVWSLWPASEATLFAHAQKLMASDDPLVWQEARTEYLDPLTERFPAGPHAEQVQQWIDQIEMHEAEQQVTRNMQRGREPKSEAERLFASAWRYEQFGDRVTAIERYRSLVELLQGDAAQRPFVNLARRQILAIEASPGDQGDRLEIVDRALAEADDLYAAGRVVEARQKWNSIVTLYGSNRELEPQVERARQRLADEPAKSP